MAVPGRVHAYNQALTLLSEYPGKYDFDTSRVVVSLHTSEYEPDLAHAWENDLWGEVEVSTDTNYARKKLQGKLVQFDEAVQRVQLVATKVSWPQAMFEVRYAVLQFQLGAFGDLPTLVAYVDFGEDLWVGDATFTLSWAQGFIMEIEGLPDE